MKYGAVLVKVTGRLVCPAAADAAIVVDVTVVGSDVRNLLLGCRLTLAE
jgi:hypothetical protein